MKVKRHGLTPRQQKFVNAYLLTLNASEAARATGYKGKYADSVGYQFLNRDSVKLCIEKELSKAIESERIGLKRFILKELRQEAERSGIFMDENFRGDTIKRINPNKMKAIEILAKYMGLLVEKHEHTGTVKSEVSLIFSNKPRQREEPKES